MRSFAAVSVIWNPCELTGGTILEVLGSFVTGSAQDHPPGHQIAADHKGNIYVVQAELAGADGSSGGTGAYKFVLKGYSPVSQCCQGVGVHSIN